VTLSAFDMVSSVLELAQLTRLVTDTGTGVDSYVLTSQGHWGLVL
jgi:hypothetical protein